MNSTPPPFGDPTRVNSENARAIGKGIGIGCGGCLTIVIGFVALILMIVAIVFVSIRNSEGVNVAVERAKKAPGVIEALGEPIEMGWLITGQTKGEISGKTVRVEIPLSGPKGTGKLYAEGSKSGESDWTFVTLELAVDGGERLQLPTARPEAEAPAALQNSSNSAK